MTSSSDSPEPITEIVERFLLLRDKGEAPELEEFCARYPESHRAEIRRRCKEAGNLGDLLAGLDQPAEDDRTVVDRDLYLNVPEQIGPYKILERVGRGGMGVVHRAEQTSPIQRQVAVKLILSEYFGSDDFVVRFKAERQALAMMNHPNIAKVFDAGVTDTNQPYFAMEFVDGVPITRFCDEHRLSIQERLQLFQQVCGAVQHAHLKGIIHRDLKPSNILVGNEGDEPVCKVIDFGLARALERKLTEKTLLTLQGQLVGTPAYMSPEQAESGNLDIDVRADVYSLGVLLYELLTGALPIEGLERVTPASIEEARRRIRDIEPVRPGSRFSVASDTARAIAESRRAQPQDLSRDLKGDLDWITLRALEKDRNRRYQSAADLSQDIQRHLDHEPVVAGPPSTAYRVSKFVRRYRVLVGASTAVFVALVGGLVASLLFLEHARVAEEKAEKSAKLAEQRADEAEQERRKTADALELAQQNEQRATRNAEEANRNAEEAERTLKELLQLSSIQIVDSLKRRADEDLWPPVSTKIPEMEDWIAEAKREVVPLLAPLNSQLERLEDEALPYTEKQAQRDRDTHPQAPALAQARAKAQELEQQLSEAKKKFEDAASEMSGLERLAKVLSEATKKVIDAGALLTGRAPADEVELLESLVSERRTYEFEDDEKLTKTEKRWRFELLRSLVAELQLFIEGPGEPNGALRSYSGEGYGSSLPEVKARLDLARRLQRETVESEAAASAWAEAITRIKLHPEYAGLELSAQEGLIPIGPDPVSDLHLEEFAVLSTGKIPERDEQGRIVVSDDMAVVLVLIPGGKFDMGAETPEQAKRSEGSPNVDPQAHEHERPVRTVPLDPFFLSKYEMTQGQWERARGARPSFYDGFAVGSWRRHPVEQVSWLDCEELLQRIGLILPTEAQWEYGARARTTSVWWPGNEVKDLEGMENVSDLSNQGTLLRPVPWDDGFRVHAPVGNFGANRFALYDVLGNVGEWCRDGYCPYQIRPRARDGLRQIESEIRIVRGGGWGSPAELARSALRLRFQPGLREDFIGVRPARIITE